MTNKSNFILKLAILFIERLLFLFFIGIVALSIIATILGDGNLSLTDLI